MTPLLDPIAKDWMVADNPDLFGRWLNSSSIQVGFLPHTGMMWVVNTGMIWSVNDVPEKLWRSIGVHNIIAKMPMDGKSRL